MHAESEGALSKSGSAAVPDSILTFVRTHAHFLVAGHVEPDGDCLSSQIACAELLRALGKSASLLSAGPFDRPEIAQFEPLFLKSAPPDLLRAPDTAAVVLDCSSFDRLGPVASQLQGLPCMVIDHHAAGAHFGDARYVVPSSPATAALVFSLYQAFGVTPSAEQARLLFFGLASDSGFFRFIRQDAGDVLRLAACLADLGAAPAEVFTQIYGGQSLENRRQLARMVNTCRSHLDGRILVASLTWAERTDARRYRKSDDDLYHLLQTVSGNEVVALIKEERSGFFSVGLRSARLDVGTVARSLGGGGHQCASGFDATGDLGTIENQLVAVLTPLVASLR